MTLGQVFWFSGLSGSGKTTLSNLLYHELQKQNIPVVLLDGDIIRTGLCRDLSFSYEDRNENIRRISEVARLFSINGICVITAFITPYQEQRNLATHIIGKACHHIYIKADIETCKTRDPKGLYKRAISGEIDSFTGISDRFDEPTQAELIINTMDHTIEESFLELRRYTLSCLTVGTLAAV